MEPPIKELFEASSYELLEINKCNNSSTDFDVYNHGFKQSLQWRINLLHAQQEVDWGNTHVTKLVATLSKDIIE